MPNPAFLVEGLMEQKFIQSVCPGAKVVTIGCNGRDAPMKTVAHFILKHLRLMKDRFYPVYIWLDREGRTESAAQLIDELTVEVTAAGFSNFVVGIPDRHTETWILHDWELVRSRSNGQPVKPATIEGCYGKALLRRALPEYTEVIMGVELLKSVDVAQVLETSPSFASFVKQINLKCWWLEQIRGPDENQPI